MNDALSVRERAEVATAANVPQDITQLIQLALEKGTPVETLEKLVALHERVADRLAASEFASALADFQNECPPIMHNAKAAFKTQSGTNVEYTYAELPHVANIIRPLLHERGFSYTWDSEMRDRLLSVTCTLKHVNGHSEKATFASPVESRAGMSEQQKYASALSYAKRMSLVQVLGITTADPDLDGADGTEPLDAAKVRELEQLAKDVNADMPRFFSYLSSGCGREIKQFSDLRRGDYKTAKMALESKRRKR